VVEISATYVAIFGGTLSLVVPPFLHQLLQKPVLEQMQHGHPDGISTRCKQQRDTDTMLPIAQDLSVSSRV